MSYSYKDYWTVTFILPTIVIVLMVIVVCAASYDFWSKTVAQRKSVEAISGYLFCILVGVFCLIPQLNDLFNGGMYLAREKEADAVIYSGVIESIQEPSDRFMGFKVSHEFGADIVINGEQYFAVTSGDITEGDFVTIHYLPNSHFILSMHKVPVDASE